MLEALYEIYHRRSVRQFTNKQIPHDLLSEVLDAAVQAPSAKNRQPWAFCVIQDRTLLRQYSDQVKEALLHAPTINRVHFEMRTKLADQKFSVFHAAPALIVICAKPEGEHPDWDCCFAAQTLMMAAHSVGLATCPIGLAWPWLKQSDTRNELKIISSYEPILAIAIGYPAEVPPAPPKCKPEILCWYEAPTAETPEPEECIPAETLSQAPFFS